MFDLGHLRRLDQFKIAHTPRVAASCERPTIDWLPAEDVGLGSFATGVEVAASPGMVRYAAESGNELFYHGVTRTNTMTETVTADCPPVVKPVSRPRSRKPATVSASALAQHLDCSRTYIGKLEAEGAIQRHGDGFPLEQSRVAYLRYLRRERKQSPRNEADADFRGLLDLIEVRLMCVGGGPTLDYADATAFLAGFGTMIDMAMTRRLN